jgi:predicted HAD superfamily phosphohydrolase
VTTTFAERLIDDRLAGHQAQTDVNRSVATGQPARLVRAMAAIHAYHQSDAYPEYDGRFNDYTVLVRITGRVRTGLGVAFELGDYAITNAEVRSGHATVYSLRNAADTPVSVFNYQIMEIES